jgi:hypothetical protein
MSGSPCLRRRHAQAHEWRLFGETAGIEVVLV